MAILLLRRFLRIWPAAEVPATGLALRGTFKILGEEEEEAARS